MEGNNTTVSSTSSSDAKLTYGNVVSKGKQYSSLDDFYVKVTQVLDSTGFNLIFNVRETSLDLYLLYLEVTRRGGFHQVALQNKWAEIVSALKLEGNNAMLSDRLEILFAILLYKFEKLYFSGTPKDGKEKKKRRGGPTGKSGYQIFLKQECARLKAHVPDIVGKNVLRMAIDAWNKMSVDAKQPYVEESKKMKETNKEVMIINDNKQKMPRLSGDSNCVTSRPLTNYSFVNNAAANVAFEMTEKTFKNPFFPVYFDTY